MATINVLNDDCLYQVFSWLSVSEKCGVQRVRRVWRRVTEDMIGGENKIELFMENPTPFGKVKGFNNAFYSKELEEFFRTGVLNDVLTTFFLKFANKEEVANCELNSLPVSLIQQLTIAQSFELVKAKVYDSLDLNGSAFKRLMFLFPNLKSLKLVNVTFADESSDWAEMIKSAQKLESLTFSAAYDLDFEAIELIRGCQNLKELKAEQLQPKDIEHLDKLEKLECLVNETSELQEIVRNHSKLALLDFTVRESTSEDVESFDNFTKLFPFFQKLQFLKELDVEYEEDSRFGPLFYSGPKLIQIQALTLNDVKLTAEDLECLAKTMPSLSKLALIDFQLKRSFQKKKSQKNEEARDSVIVRFLDFLTTFSFLKKLYLQYFIPRTYQLRNEACQKQTKKRFPSRLLSGWLDAEKLPRLRLLACNCFDLDDCFEAFCQLASNSPKLSYEFKEYGNYNPPIKLSEEVRKKLPRNVRLF